MDVQMMNDEEEQDVDSDQQTESRGYCIEVYVKPDGTFSISPPEYKESEEKEGAHEAESLPDALKIILQTIKENPVSGDATGEMEAGFMAGPAGKKPMSYNM